MAGKAKMTHVFQCSVIQGLVKFYERINDWGQYAGALRQLSEVYSSLYAVSPSKTTRDDE